MSGLKNEVSATKVSFTLKNARGPGAVLTADKVFANGQTERLDCICKLNDFGG